ncbi:hypothetical protein [Sphingomonas sp. NPDC079357]|uniref:hypothetical protein n=1 Tax=Sphingomonas sp. NPDC079357 TaxID=3364518 RepID=UPI003851638E
MTEGNPPTTPDGRYMVVRGRLWRMSNPALSQDTRQALVVELMAARRAVQSALRRDDPVARRAARSRVDAAKVALGERGPVWWTDGTPDLNRRLARNTGYADWYAQLATSAAHG